MKGSCQVQVPEAWEKAAGWRFNERGLLVGNLLTSRFVDPAFIPELEDSPELMRTTLDKPEYCESMTKRRSLMSIFWMMMPFAFNRNLQLRAPPEDMGFFAP